MKNQWRTVGISALGILTLGIVGALAGRWTGISAIYPSLVGGVVGCVGSVAAKAYGEHKANAAKPEVQP